MTLAVVQCRLGSTRFPRKALADLNGKPIIQHVVERASQISGVAGVVVAVPHEDIDEFNIKHCDIAGPLVAGSDVLGRFAAIVRSFYPAADTLIRITGDCPLLDPSVCARVLNLYRESGAQYAWTNTPAGEWPDGLDCEVFSRQLLMRADASATSPHEREHVTPWMRTAVPPASLPPDPAYAGWPKLSIDTPEDLERVRAWMQQH